MNKKEVVLVPGQNYFLKFSEACLHMASIQAGNKAIHSYKYGGFTEHNHVIKGQFIGILTIQEHKRNIFFVENCVFCNYIAYNFVIEEGQEYVIDNAKPMKDVIIDLISDLKMKTREIEDKIQKL